MKIQIDKLTIFSLRTTITHQLGWTRLKKDGQCIGYTSYTIDKAKQDGVIIHEGRSWVREEIEHREIHHRLDHCIKMVDCILGKKVSQAAHARGTLPPVL